VIISEIEYRLQTVPRWGIVRTIQKQSVAEHSFYVAIAAARFAKEYWVWGPNDNWCGLHRYALLHDLSEAITGDIPSIAKHYVVDDYLILEDYENHVEETPGCSPGIVAIVKAADHYESCRFIATELSMGNLSVGIIFQHCLGALEKHMLEHGKSPDAVIDELRGFSRANIDPMVAT
jgi:hypothetical protein